MWKMRNELCLGLFIVFICTVIAYTFEVLECHSKAAALGYKCSYGIFSGCVLEKADGKKVLLEQLRDFDN